MKIHSLFLTIVCLSNLFCPALLNAQIFTLAKTGDSPTDVADATWDRFEIPSLTNQGSLTFVASLGHEEGVISGDNDHGVWLIENGGNSLVAQTGAENVPGIADVSFASFDTVSRSDSGSVVIRGALATGTHGVTTNNNQGLWQFGDSNTLLARQRAGNVPEVPGANFENLKFAADGQPFVLANNGNVAIASQLEIPVGGVTLSNDKGIWQFGSGGSSLVAREGIGGVPDLNEAIFNSFLLPALNSNDQLALLASLKTTGGITHSNSLGVWLYSNTGNKLIAQTGSGNVPEVAGASFTGIDRPLLNDLGEVVFSAELSGSGGQGVWSYSETSETLLAISGTGGVPDVPDVNFEEFTVTAINNIGQVLVEATLELGIGEVTDSSNRGLWLLGENNSLLARSGDGNVPGVPSANFASFAARSLNDDGQVAVVADLQVGIGDVDESDDSGIWILDAVGNSLLVAREGDQLAGGTIATLDLQGDELGQTSGFNDFGELAFRATFTDGDSGLFLFRPRLADFDRDGDVDDADLSMWETAFAHNSAADSDSDNDTDGADFLVWQREFGSGVALQATNSAVPEPASWLLLAMGTLFCLSRRHN